MPKRPKQATHANLVKDLIEDIDALLHILETAEESPWLFAGHAPLVSLTSDASLWQSGGTVHHLKPGELGSGDVLRGELAAMYGESLPDVLFGKQIAGKNMGLAEATALYLNLKCIEHDAIVAVLFYNRRLMIRLDNQELVYSLRSGRTSGIEMLEKRKILMLIFALLDRMLICASFYWVSSALNSADWPSRSLFYATERLVNDIFVSICQQFMRFTLDAFSSQVCMREVQVVDGNVVAARFAKLPWTAEDGWDLLPFYSQMPDAYAICADALSQQPAEESIVWCFPPRGALAGAAADWMRRNALRGALCIATQSEPLPDWFRHLLPFIEKSMEISGKKVEVRKAKGWCSSEIGPLTVYFVNCQRLPSLKKAKN